MFNARRLGLIYVKRPLPLVCLRSAKHRVKCIARISFLKCEDRSNAAEIHCHDRAATSSLDAFSVSSPSVLKSVLLDFYHHPARDAV